MGRSWSAVLSPFDHVQLELLDGLGVVMHVAAECPFRCHRDDLHPPTLHPMNGADLFQKLERIGHVGCFRPRDVAEVGGGLGAFVGLPAEVAADRQRIDRASLACAVVFAASKRRSVTAS